MATTSPARIDDDLYASAKLAGGVQSRSASQQVVHWARIGREIEASAGVSHKEIAEVLAASRSYDMLSAKEQAVIRAEWSARMDTIREALNLAARYAAAGRTWVELDDDGNIIEGGHGTKGGAVVEDRKPGGPDRGTVVHGGLSDGNVIDSGKGTAAIKGKKASGGRAGARPTG